MLFWVSLTVQVIGGAWIVWMGQSMVRSGWANRTSPLLDLAEAEASLGTVRHSFVQGMTTNLSNPKIVLFLAALVVPLLPAHPSVLTSVGL